MEFVEYTIADVLVSLKTGKTPQTSNPEYFDGDILWAGPSDFVGKKYITETERTITKVALEKNEAHLYQSDTILISTIGEIGKVAIVDRPMSANQQITGIKLKENIILPELFYYWVLLNKKVLEDKANKAIISQLNNKLLRRINLRFPKKIKDQQAFIYSLNNLQKLIDFRIESINYLNGLIKSIFFEWFGDPIIDNKKNGKKPLAFFGKWSTGGTPPRSTPIYFQGNIPWFTSGELNSTYLTNSNEYITESALINTSAKKVEKGSLLIGMYDTAALKIGITQIDSSCNQAIAFSKLDITKCHPLFIYHNLLYARDYYLNKRKGARQKNFKLSMIESLEVLDIGIDKQNLFADKVEQILNLIDIYKAHLSCLTIYFNSILQKAFVENKVIDESLFFENLISSLSLNDLKEKKRLNILVDWMSKKQKKFTSFEKYDNAYKMLLALLDDGSLEQKITNLETVLKIKK